MKSWILLFLYHANFTLFYIFLYTQLLGTDVDFAKYKSMLELIGIGLWLIGAFTTTNLFGKLVKKKKLLLIACAIYLLFTLFAYIVYRFA